MAGNALPRAGTETSVKKRVLPAQFKHSDQTDGQHQHWLSGKEFLRIIAPRHATATASRPEARAHRPGGRRSGGARCGARRGRLAAYGVRTFGSVR